MKAAALVLTLLLAAQAVAAGVMVVLGKALQTMNPDAGWLPWTVVGAIGVAASVGFLAVCLDVKRWIQWPKTR